MRKQKRRSPAFQLYAADWLSSPSILLMNPAQEGAYLRLLLMQWVSPDFALPNDAEKLARLSRLGDSWAELGPAVKACFDEHPNNPNKIINKRLDSELKKQREWKRKSALGGIKSGQSRRKATKGGSPLVQPKGDSSSSSSSSDLFKENPVPFEGQAFLTALAAYEQLRKEKGSELVPTSRKALYSRLLAMGEAMATLALRQSVEAGWLRVFHPKEPIGGGEHPNAYRPGKMVL